MPITWFNLLIFLVRNTILELVINVDGEAMQRTPMHDANREMK
jgi:hypothetical protein